MPLVTRRTGIWTSVLVVLCASVAVEVVQGVFGLRASDIDDVIANTLGGFLGVAFFTLLLVLVRRWSRVMAVMAVLSLLAVPMLSYPLFAVRLRL
ncbi:VanZ family protein [Terrabacter sp. NPDC080008]|uniref:VanZ family protein n=1 Tax=Terrabacter sp. NPDC080008 TaxID=3155176 RepID=UPI00344EA5BD